MRHLLLLLMCISLASWGQTFNEVALESGIDFQPIAVSSMGGGVAWFDFDNDGWEDAYITGSSLHDRLYRNNADGTFTDMTGSAGIESSDIFNTTAVTTADVDRDGWTDVFVSTWRATLDFSYAPNLLFHNNGDGTFTEMGAELGLADSSFTMCGTFVDINKDGWIDLYTGNYVEDPAFLYDDENQIIGFDHDCFHDQFYLNNGDGTFTNATELFGMDNEGCTLAVRNSDIDLDQDQDLIIANDFGEWVIPNKLFRNDFPDQSVAEVGSPSNAAAQMYAMGIATGDYDHDGDLDHYLTNLGRNLFMEKQESLFYFDKSTEAGIENTGWDSLLTTSWATGWADFDNDTWEDLFVVNGYVPAIAVVANHVQDPNKLYRNNGDGTFEDISDASGTADTGQGRGGALCDYDQDGDLDLLVVNIFNAASPDPEAVRLFENQGNDGNWVEITLEGTVSNVDAIGSLIEIEAGGLTLLREISGGGDTHASQHSRRVHVGLGDIEEIQSVTIHWPNGLVDILTDPAINESHHLIEGFSIGVTEQASAQVRLFPNPALEYCVLQGLPQGSLQWQVFDGTGRMFKEFQSQSPTHILQVGDWPSGIYVLKSKDSNQLIAKRLIVRPR